MRALGVDYGRRRIGLALSDASGVLARPWKTLERSGNPSEVARALADELRKLADAGEPVAVIVIGHPRRLNGEPNEQTPVVEQVANHLRRLVGARLVLQDERLSSHEADARLSLSEKDWRKRKARIDAAAAAVILQDYLDSAPGQADAEDAE